ncbi:unnamed protein product, partial [Adineta steineri]
SGVNTLAGSFALNVLNRTTLTCGSCTNYDTLYFGTSGGTPYPGLANNGTEFAFDDLFYNGLRVGGTMEVCGDATLHVSSINDSRCPANVMCFWAGQAKVQLLLSNKVASTTMDIIAGASAQATLGTNVYTVTLDDVIPYPGMNKNPSEAIVTVTCS